MGDATKSLAAEIEAKAIKARAGLALSDDILTELYSDWTPEAGAQFTDRRAAEAVEGICLARELLAEIAALQSRAFEDGARWMRERAAELVNSASARIADRHAAEDENHPGQRHAYTLWLASSLIATLPLQPEGERNA